MILSVLVVGSEAYRSFSSYPLDLYRDEPLTQAICKLYFSAPLFYFINYIALPVADIL